MHLRIIREGFFNKERRFGLGMILRSHQRGESIRYTCEWEGPRDDELRGERGKRYVDYVGRRRTWKTLDRHRVPTDVSHFFYSGLFFLSFFFILPHRLTETGAVISQKNPRNRSVCFDGLLCASHGPRDGAPGNRSWGKDLALSPFLSRSLRPSVCPSRSLYPR